MRSRALNVNWMLELPQARFPELVRITPGRRTLPSETRVRALPVAGLAGGTQELTNKRNDWKLTLCLCKSRTATLETDSVVGFVKMPR